MGGERWHRTAAIAAGGALGASGRWAVVEAVGSTTFPWPVLLINLAGSFLLGVLLARSQGGARAHLAAHDFGAIGFCGGLTTFSTFAVEVARLLDRGDVTAAALYALLSVAGTIAAVLAGAALLHRPSSVVQPVEEEP